MPLTPADVHNVAFSKPPIGKRGYNEDEVDAFLDLVEAELTRLIEENTDLRQRIEELDHELAAARRRRCCRSAHPGDSHLPAEPEPEPEPVRPAPVAAPAAAPAPTGTNEEQAMKAARVLALAQDTADRLTSTAKADSDKMLADARANADQIVSEADTPPRPRSPRPGRRADTMLADAQSRSESSVAPSPGKGRRAAGRRRAQALRDHGHHQPATHGAGRPPRAAAHVRARIPDPAQDLPGIAARGVGPARVGGAGRLQRGGRRVRPIQSG